MGLPSVVESALLPSLMGWGKAREVLYTGDAIPAAEALAFGLVERVVPPDQLDGRCRALDQLDPCLGPARGSSAESVDAPLGGAATR